MAKYVLYMWQVEDLLRAFRMDIREIDRCIVSGFQVDMATRREIRDWYDNLIEMMKQEQVTTTGHLQVVKNIINELEELHLYLLQQEKNPRYRQLHSVAAPHLAAFRQKSGLPPEVLDVEIALQALYGQLLLRLQKKHISSQTQQAMDTFSQMLAYLAAKYQQVEKEEQ